MSNANLRLAAILSLLRFLKTLKIQEKKFFPFSRLTTFAMAYEQKGKI